MINTLYPQIMGIITRIQNYPGIKGLEEVDARVRKICRDHNQPFPESIALFLKAYEIDRQDNLLDAVEHYKTCLNATQPEEVQLTVFVNGLLASVYNDCGDYQSAYACYAKTLENLHLVDDNIRALIYCNLSDMHLSLGKFEEAKQYARKAVTSSQNANRQLDCAVSHLNLAYGCAYTGEFDQAIRAIAEAKKIAESLSSNRTFALCHGYLAQTMVQQGRVQQDEVQQGVFTPSDVLDAFYQAEQYFLKINDDHNRMENLVCWFRYLVEIGELEQAQERCLFLEQNFDIKNSYHFYSIYAKTKAKIFHHQQDCNGLASLQTEHIELSEKYLKAYERKQSDRILQSVDTLRDKQQHEVFTQMQKYMGAITDIGQFIATAPDLYSVLPEILSKINTILPTFEFGIALYDDESDILDYQYFVDTQGLVQNLKVTCQDNQTVGTYVIRKRATVHLNSVTDDTLEPYVDKASRKDDDLVVVKDKPDTNSIILTPIILNERVIGLLSVQHHLPNQYQQHHCQLIEHLASFIAVSLENQKQRQRLESANQTLEVLSTTDPLTGLSNRYQLDKITPVLIRNAYTQKRSLAVLMIDIDEYKAYNDFHGHLQGDEALRILSRLLRSTFSTKNDYLFRYGGDEFMAICFGQSSEDIEEKVVTLRNALSELALVSPKAIRAKQLTLSIGGVNVELVSDNVDSNFKMICDIADKQLYRVKESGRNNYNLIDCYLNNCDLSNCPLDKPTVV